MKKVLLLVLLTLTACIDLPHRSHRKQLLILNVKEYK